LKKALSLGLVLLSGSLFGQNNGAILQKIETTMIFEKKPSIISIPIDISIGDLQKQINEGLPDLIYEDNNFNDNDNDGLKVKVWRKGNLIFTENKDGVLTYEVPLKIWAQKEISVLGISQAPSTNFEIKVKFSSKFGITDDYEIETKTKGLGYTWITKPVLKAGFVDVPIAPVIGKVITSNFELFSEQIDKTIKEGYSLKPYLIEAWNLAKRPIQVSEEYNTWIKADPVEVFYTPLQSVGTSLKSTLGIKIYVETFVGTPLYTPSMVVDVPKLKVVKSIPDEFELQLLNIVSYEEANNISKKKFVGETFEFSNGKYKVVVKGLSIGHENENVTFTIITEGSFKGTIGIKGVPVYDEQKGMVVLDKVHLDVKTRNFLHKAAAWLLEGTLERKVKEEFGLPVNEIIEYSRKSIHETVNSEFSKGIRMQGQILSIKPAQILVSDEGILALVNSKAKVQLIVKGM
jgi:hypothetical protein